MSIEYVGLFAAQEGRAQLYGTCTKDEGRSYRSPVSHAPGGNDGNSHRIYHLWQKREQARLHACVDTGESATMSAGFHALRYDGVDASLLQHPRFSHGRGAGDDENSGVLDGVDY